MSSMHLINQICAIMQNCIQKKNLDDFFTFFCPALTLDFLFFFYFFFSSVKSSFGTFGTKGTTTEEGRRPPERSTINNTQSRNFFCYNLSLSIIRQKDFLLFSLSKILEVLLQVVINAVATFWKKRADVVTWGRSFIYKIIKFENP